MRKLLVLCLAGAMVFGQEFSLKAPVRISISELAETASREAVYEQPTPQQQQQASATPQAAPSKRSSSKKKWIMIAAVAGGAAVGVWAINKRLSNEGKGIF
jgi:Flp pilus assembly protein TadB